MYKTAVVDDGMLANWQNSWLRTTAVLHLWRTLHLICSAWIVWIWRQYFVHILQKICTNIFWFYFYVPDTIMRLLTYFVYRLRLLNDNTTIHIKIITNHCNMYRKPSIVTWPLDIGIHTSSTIWHRTPWPGLWWCPKTLATQGNIFTGHLPAFQSTCDTSLFVPHFSGSCGYV